MTKRARFVPCGFLLCAAGLLAAVGCASSPGPSSTTTPAPSGSGISFSKEVQPIFNDNCVICHQGASGPAGLSLASGAAYKNLVNVKSSESPLVRVAPGAPDKSYIINKLSGTQGQVGGAGGQMPLGGAPLSPVQLGAIQQWISQGAPDN